MYEVATACSVHCYATVTRHKDKEEIYKKLNLEILFELDISKAVELGILADYVINVIQIPLDKDRVNKYWKIQKQIRGHWRANVELLLIGCKKTVGNTDGIFVPYRTN